MYIFVAEKKVFKFLKLELKRECICYVAKTSLFIIFWLATSNADALLDYCDQPPVIENAEVLQAANLSAGGKVFYACLKGYTRLSGDSILTCTLSDNLVHSWSGSIMKCGVDRK